MIKYKMVTKDYSKLTKEEILKIVEKQDEELKLKKYGIVWDAEKEPEKVVVECKNNLPILKRVSEKKIRTDDGKDNILIEGDNYHALTVLNYTHKGKIDVIYIDPPYNTGNAKEWKYNDRWVNKEDGYRHSKWLNFMEKRLNLAKRLMSKKGVIFISIDDNELGQLKLLGDKIFGEKNFESFIWKKKGGAGNTEKIIGCLTEHIVCYFKNKKEGIFNYRFIDRTYKYKDEKGPYNLAGIEKTNLGAYQRKTMRDPIIDPKTKKKFLPSKNMRWTIGKTTALKAAKEGKLFFDYKKKKVYYIKRPEGYDTSKNVYYNLLTDFGSLATAKKELENFFKNREIFDTPKPTPLIIHLLEIASKKDSVILDFFAGSGTTGQAVLSLNSVDEGDRNFILCTNNEDNNGDGKKICTDICYPRLEKVIKGYKNKKGEKIKSLGGNIQYFKTSLIKKSNNRDQVKINLTQECTEMLCVKENIFNLKKKGKDYKIFESNKKENFLCIYYNFLDKSFNDFLREIKKLKGEKVVYMFSLEDKVDKSLFKNIEDIRFEAIPKKILEVYKQLVKLNIKK